MKKSLLILFLLQSICAAAQVRISDFKLVVADGAASDVRTSLQDPDGRLCAVLKLEARQNGWTFDAGLAGIMDTRYETGVIWLYVPASARKLTVAHKEYGVLRDWNFPVSLEPGRTYTMKLSYERPRPAPTPKASDPRTTTTPTPQRKSVAPQASFIPERPARVVVRSEERNFCNHFADFYTGFSCSKEYSGKYEFSDDYWFGFTYTWIGNRVGPYLSAGLDFDMSYSVIGGAAFRLTNPQTASLDWQLYGGAGLIDGSFGFDVGTRFAWRSTSKLSHWDFGFGCQFFHGNIMPTVSVGLYIWGIPAVIGLSLVVCSIGG